MSDAHEAMQVFLATQQRVDEVLSSVHSLKSQVEVIGERMDERLAAMDGRLSTLEDAHPGGKKPVAVAAGVGGGVGFLGALASSGVIEILVSAVKRAIQ